MPGIDLNCDMGESTELWPYSVERDLSLLPFLTSVNIACGFHAGDAHTMHRLVGAASDHGVAVGAHPGFPDRKNFGRTEMVLSASEIYDMIVYQVGALDAFMKVSGGRLHHVKPHGALYNMAAKDAVLASAICKAVHDSDRALILYGLSGSKLISEAHKIGLSTCSEVFADRTYQDDGTLTPRSQPNAMIHDTQQSLAQVLQMVRLGKVTSVNGREVPIVAETVCLHSDGENALAFAQAIHAALKDQQISVQNKRAAG